MASSSTTGAPIAERSLLDALDLACRRGGRLVFEGVEFALEAGDALVLRGPNGSGKSSLLRLLAGLIRPVSGHLSWAGTDIAASASEHRARLHYIAHADGLKPSLELAANLQFAAALAGVRGELPSALAGFGLETLAGTPVRYLSAGQRRRAALARLLLAPRPLWLLDEPGVGLDRASRNRLETAIAAHRRTGGIAVVATHGDVEVPSALVLDMPG
jgi:heme exporter protein A